MKTKLLALMLAVTLSTAARAAPTPASVADAASVAKQLKVGDVVFIRVPFPLFLRVADATHSWTNHVGVVIDVSGDDPLIAESTVPWSRVTTLSRFAARSDQGRVEVRSLDVPLTDEQRARIRSAAEERLHVLYDTGFNLHSRRQFCSRFVREVLYAGTGMEIGEVQSFAQMLKANPDTPLGFWRAWYFGRIPWDRETVTPASLLNSPHLQRVFAGFIKPRPCGQPA